LKIPNVFHPPKKKKLFEKKKSIFLKISTFLKINAFIVLKLQRVIGYIYIYRTLLPLLTKWVTKMNPTNINSVEVHPSLSHKGAPSGW
jgi:hypothetical protein